MKKQLLLLLSFVVSGMFAPVYLYAGEKKGNAPHYGISVAVKTNLYSLTGFTPDFEYATVMPNLEAELFFSDRWSISVSGLYSHFEGCKCIYPATAFLVLWRRAFSRPFCRRLRAYR